MDSKPRSPQKNLLMFEYATILLMLFNVRRILEVLHIFSEQVFYDTGLLLVSNRLIEANCNHMSE